MSEKEYIKSYDAPAAGWGALKAVTKSWLGSQNGVKNIRAMLKTNQNAGFDCPGCAWGEAPENGKVRFCENGAKAVNWEASGKTIGAGFFAQYSVAELDKMSDYWLEDQGRLTQPMRYNPVTGHYVETSWIDAFELIAKHLKNVESPNEVEFYTSGRASNEAAFLYQLFVRVFGTNNFPDCSNMCHEASGIGMMESLGVGKGTVVFEDFDKADAIFVIGQNPGTNHPRMLEPLRNAVERGTQVICLNPLKERGLERFQHPQNPMEMLSNGSKPTHTAYFRPALGGDMSVMRGMAKFLLKWEREAQAQGLPPVFDHDFIQAHASDLDPYLLEVDSTPWQHIINQSGLRLDEIECAARMYREAKSVIMCWAMGVTQHRHSVATVQEIVNLQLLCGNVGKPGAGLSPVRGHSNVQGDRTMGINEQPPEWFLDALEKRFQFNVPRDPGHNTVQAIQAMEERRSKIFIALGGNFAQATPDSARTHAALRNCNLTVNISTKLNRSHLTTGRDALILPCLGRTEIDIQGGRPQGITVEDTFSMVHLSHGQLAPASPDLRSEPAIIAGIAKATLGTHPIDWEYVVSDYSRIRRLISETIPDFEDFNDKLKQPGGFHLKNNAARRIWRTPSKKAQFITNRLPENLKQKDPLRETEKPDLILQTLRSHDQYNTTVYGLDDRYRGIFGLREVIFINRNDIRKLGFAPGERADIVSVWNDGRERRVANFMIVEYDIPEGQAAAYYPETNPLVPLESYGKKTFTPTSKYIGIKLQKATSTEVIPTLSA